jgi:hypothetical protein
MVVVRVSGSKTTSLRGRSELAHDVAHLLVEGTLAHAVVGALAADEFLHHAAQRVGAQRVERHVDRFRLLVIHARLASQGDAAGQPARGVMPSVRV